MNAIAFSVLTCIARGFIRSSILSEQTKKHISFKNSCVYPDKLVNNIDNYYKL